MREELPDAHLIVRTAWLYGAHGGCFPKTIARVARERGEVSVVDDQVGQPTWTVDVAGVVLRPGRGRRARRDLPRHVVGPGAAGSTSRSAWWWPPAWSRPRSCRRRATTFVRPAPRPAYSVLGHDALVRLGLEPIGDWESRWAEAATSVLA